MRFSTALIDKYCKVCHFNTSFQINNKHYFNKVAISSSNGTTYVYYVYLECKVLFRL